MLLPKLCYLFLFFLGLVATSPVALEERSLLDPRAPNLDEIVEKQEIENVNHGESERTKTFRVYRSVVTFKDGNQVQDKHIVGLAKAGWDKMNALFEKELEEEDAKDKENHKKDKNSKKKKNLNKGDRPHVMTAMKVGNKVYLASSIKGGKGNYIYQTFEGDDQYNGEFTTVLDNARAGDVKEALMAVSAESQDTVKKTTDKDKQTDPKKDKHTAPQVGKMTSGEPSAAGSSSGQGVTNRRRPAKNPTIYQHTNNAGCGEVMASIEYHMTAESDHKLKGKSPKPKIVAWEGEDKKGEPYKNEFNGQITDEMTGQMKEPCGKEHENDGCGEGWGCKAFTGQKGMNFDVIKSVKKLTDKHIMLPRANDFPEIVDIAYPKFPAPEKYKLPEPETKGTDKTGSRGGRGGNRGGRGGNRGGRGGNRGGRGGGRAGRGGGRGTTH
ncbi:hypothetical protein BDV32DRAFT_152190 [Aspergillus pseudonomiae]|nr:hypothetical protein BDV32DRAFT_152190 [Aspergillus pseudonomiae]